MTDNGYETDIEDNIPPIQVKIKKTKHLKRLKTNYLKNLELINKLMYNCKISNCHKSIVFPHQD